jgi:prepilin-type processing-associated H-X9-DG protein
MFLLARTMDITPEVFVCPSSEQRPLDLGGRPLQSRSNWNGAREVADHLSYSFANPYLDDGANAWYWKSSAVWGADFAAAADKNPGGAPLLAVTFTSQPRDMTRANSRNHDRRGQNVLYGDGHVDFQVNPFVGVQRDNIYARRAGRTGSASSAVVASPCDRDDSVLLPCDESGP